MHISLLFRPVLILLLAIGVFSLANTAAVAAGSDLKVIASIRPLHSLVAGVMQGVGVPKLLVASGSPHTYSFKPSDARALEQSRAVFWVGKDLEHFLEAPMKTLATKAEIVALGEIEGVNLLKIRSNFYGKAHPVDMHMWLDPDNASQFVRHIVLTLSRKDPANAAVYEANGAYQLQRLTELSSEIEDLLKSLEKKKSIFYHDAFQYFEHRFGLESAGFVSIGTIRSPGAKRIRNLRNLIVSGAVQCVLTEPQFAPAIVQSLVENTNVNVRVLDPMGAGWIPGPDLYFNMMRKNAAELQDCLAQ